MNTIKWKKSCIILFVTHVLLLSGCSSDQINTLLDSQKNDEKHVINGIEYNNNSQFYADTVTQFLSCIDSGDRDGIKSLLCNALKNTNNIDDVIDDLISGFEGDIINVTEYSQCSVGESSYGEEYTSAFLNNEFYITTDKQVYSAYVAICPLDEKHSDGQDVVGIYTIVIETLDYAMGDRESLDNDSVEVAGHSCYVQSFYGDSSGYLPVQSAMNKDGVIVYRILQDHGAGGKYDDFANWNSRDFDSFKTTFGNPYASSSRNDMGSLITDAYVYEITDSEKYVAVTVYRDTGEINTLRIMDIYSYRNDEEDLVVFDHEE